VAEVLDDWFARLEQILDKRRVETIEPRHENQPLCASPGNADGVELEIAEPSDDLVARAPGRRPSAPRTLRHPRPLGSEQTGTSECKTASLADGEGFHDS